MAYGHHRPRPVRRWSWRRWGDGRGV